MILPPGIFSVSRLPLSQEKNQDRSKILTRGENPADVQLIGNLLSLILQTILGIGATRIALKSVGGEKATLGDLFTFRPYFLKYLAASLLILLLSMVIMWVFIMAGAILSHVWGLEQDAIMGVVVACMILAAIPLTILGIRFGFFSLFMVDKGLGPVQSLKQSWALTKGSTGQLLLFTLIFIGVNILGAVALLVGLLVTLPMTFLAEAYIYQKLLAPTQAA